MKRTITYRWEESDPSLVPVDEAVNRLANFKKAEDVEVFQKVYNRVITRGSDFSEGDVQIVLEYLLTLAYRAECVARERERQNVVTERRDEQAVRQEAAVIQSLLQAAQNARDRAAELWEIFVGLLVSALATR